MWREWFPMKIASNVTFMAMIVMRTRECLSGGGHAPSAITITPSRISGGRFLLTSHYRVSTTRDIKESE
jgi:hypothetical protein